MIDRNILLRGKSYPIDKNINLKIPTLDEIDNMGYDTYKSHLSILLSRNVDIADVLYYKYDIWYEDVSSMHVVFAYAGWKEALEFFTGISNLQQAQDKNGDLFITNYYDGIDNSLIININEKVMDEIREVLREIHLIGKTKHPLEQAKSKFVKKTILRRQDYDRNKGEHERFKDKITLSSIIESMAWRSESSGLNIFNIWELTISQLYSGYKRICKQDKYKYIMTGLYNGSLDLQKANINIENEFWANLV
jgi:hypothetical protein